MLGETLITCDDIIFTLEYIKRRDMRMDGRGWIWMKKHQIHPMFTDLYTFVKFLKKLREDNGLRIN